MNARYRSSAGTARLRHADFSGYYGTGRDTYDRVAARAQSLSTSPRHYRGPSSSRATRRFDLDTRHGVGMRGFAESSSSSPPARVELARSRRTPSRASCRGGEGPPTLHRRGRAQTAPYWDTGAPGLAALGDGANGRPTHTPTSRSTAPRGDRRAGLLRLGTHLASRGRARRTCQPAPRRGHMTDRTGPSSHRRQSPGLLLHWVYPCRRGDHVPQGSRIPRGESRQWATNTCARSRVVRRAGHDAPYLSSSGVRLGGAA